MQLQLVRKLFDKEVPEQVKQQIFQTLVPWMSHRAWLASYTRNYLLNNDYTPLEQYNFARHTADAAGPSARVRVYLWTFIDKLQASNPDAAAAACEIFVKQYPQDTLEARQANILLLQQKASGKGEPSIADIKLLQQQIQQDTDAWKSAITELLPSLKTTDPKATQTAVAAIIKLVAQTPVKPVKYLSNTEASRGYPIFNWLSPWKRTGGWVNLRQFGEHMSYVFEGQNASISLLRTGGLDWQIDQGPIGHIVKLNGEQADYILATDLSLGQHILRIGTGSMPTDENDWKSNNVFIKSVNVQGQTLASPAVRFSQDGKLWGPWQQPSDTSAISLTIAIPASPKPRFAQAGIWLDSRPTKCTQSPVVTELNIRPSHATGQTASTFQRGHVSRLTDEPNAVASLLAQRCVVVTYSKIGGDQTYKLARAIANKANVYLVSDDIGLNNYPGLVLAVGSPLRHRYTRQLLATHALWLDAAYLQNADGLVTIAQELPGQPQTLYVMGETQGAIDAAGARLLAALDKIQQQQTTQPANNVALFAGSTLEMIYPWQLHTDRTKLIDLSLRMAQNDRRSFQWGLRADGPLTSLPGHDSLRKPLENTYVNRSKS